MRARVRLMLLAGCLIVVACVPARASALDLQSIGPSFDQPVFGTSPPGDPRLFVVERPGFIQVVHDGTVSPSSSTSMTAPPLTMSVGCSRWRSIRTTPPNGLFYAYYTGDGPNAGRRPGRHPHRRVPCQLRIRTSPTLRAGEPCGLSATQPPKPQRGPAPVWPGRATCTSRSATTRMGPNAQSVANPYGKILRLDPHGRGQGTHGVPPDKPIRRHSRGDPGDLESRSAQSVPVLVRPGDRRSGHRRRWEHWTRCGRGDRFRTSLGRGAAGV